MGGDNAPSVVAEGAVRAVRHAAENNDTEPLALLLFGLQDQVEAALDAACAAHDCAPGDLPIQVVHAPEVIAMGEAPTAAVKKKQQSSIHLGLGACKKGQADAFASAGNTGALMAASLFILGRLPGVDRPTVMGMVPTVEGTCLLMDVGTNVDCRPAHLVQFARMGAVYVRSLGYCDTPTVGLLNVGEEPGKGNELTREAYELLAEAPDLDFAGNVEGRDLPAHAADVVVCDGFTGNITLKFGESLGTTLLEAMVRREIEKQGLGREEAAVVQRVLRGVQEPFDYEARGAVPLLGVEGNVLVGHGSSSARAVERMIQTAAEVASQDVPAAITTAFESAPSAS